MTRRQLLLVFAAVLAFRLLHARVLWVEEAYPMAAAVNLFAGRHIYSGFWFDKPPLFAYLYTLWGAESGTLLRIAGAAYVTLCAWLMARLAGTWIAGALLAFFLTFDTISAVMVLGPDLLTLAPVLAAVVWRDRPILAGALLGLGFHCNVKAALFLILLPSPKAWLSFASIAAPVFALDGYFAQVWEWGSLYARSTFLDHPWRDGALKTFAWIGFHAALVFGAIRGKWNRLVILWLVAAMACVVAGERFFPRYYFHLLPPLCLLAAQGWSKWGRWRWAMVLLLAIPAVRYAPGYWRVERSRDLAMFRDAKSAAGVIEELKRPGDTIFVWGYRPEIDAIVRLPGGTPFLESQPLTGVFADRHLGTTAQSAPDEFAKANRQRLTKTSPTFVVDGLGRYNPALAIAKYPDLAEWLARYEVAGITNGSIVYRIRR